MLVGFTGSALFSGMETGCYCLNRVRLHVFATHGNRRAIGLERAISNPTSLLSTLLIGNNITNYMGTAGLAVILSASGLSDGEQMLLNTLIVTPMLFVFGETLPKDLFSAHADALMYRLQPVLKAAEWLFTLTLMVPIVGLFSAGVLRVVGQRGDGTVFHPRRRVGELVKEGLGYGILSDAQSTMIERVLSSAGTTVADHMTPWRKVPRLRDDDDLEAVRALALRGTPTHLPVTDRAGHVVGVLDIMDVLAANHGPHFKAKQALTQALTLDHGMHLRRALAEMKRLGAKWALVVDAHGKPLGGITPRDVLEPITGPLPH